MPARKKPTKVAIPTVKTYFVVGTNEGSNDKPRVSLNASDLHTTLQGARDCCIDEYDDNACVLEIQIVAAHIKSGFTRVEKPEVYI